MLPVVHIEGRLVEDPELRFTPSGKPVASCRVAASDSRRVQGTDEWETLEQLFLTVPIWGGDAEEVAERLRKGQKVIASGRLYTRNYDRQDGSKGTAVELKFATIAAVVERPRDQQMAQQPPAGPWATPPQQQGHQQPQGPWGPPPQQAADPWGQPPQGRPEEPPF